MQVRLIHSTNEGEKLILYIARVSNPENQESTNTGLINYLIKHDEWSPFEMADMCVEIKTSRAISRQILRHWSFSFQEFSQRYAVATEFEPIELRRQAAKNRQSTTEVFDPVIRTVQHERDWDSSYSITASQAIAQHLKRTEALYNDLLAADVGRECARMILPETTSSTLYMKSNLRDWIHYINLRVRDDTQKEHRDIANAIKPIFAEQFPIIAEALGW